MKEKKVGVEGRRPISFEIIEFASALADKAEGLSEATDIRLREILRPVEPGPPHGPRAANEEYPPLFESLRVKLVRIEAALSDIEYTILRAEV